MKPVKFKQSNVIYCDSLDEYLPLPACYVPDLQGQVITCWELTDEDLKKLQETKRIYVSQLTLNNPLQPIYVSANKGEIFINPEED